MATEINHGRYVVRTMQAGAGWKALAFRGNKAIGNVLAGASEAAAILAATSARDAADAEQRAQRGPGGFPTACEVREALAAIKITPKQRVMLDAHGHAADYIMTATALAKAAGYSSYETVNSQYGILGRELAKQLEWEPSATNGKIIWTFTLATGADGDTRADIKAVGHHQWRWKLRPEIVQALLG